MTPLTALGTTIAERRRRLGFSVDEVARLSGLEVTQVHAVEGDAAVVTMGVLEALGKALVFDPATLLRGEAPPDARRMPGWFRSHTDELGDAIVPEDARLFALCAELGRVGAFLAQQLGEDPCSMDVLGGPAPIASQQDQAWRQGYRLGALARERLEHFEPTLPATRPLRSIQRTLERLGIHVACVQLRASSKHAVSIAQPGAMPIVLLNFGHERVRRSLSRRAVLAHELGHLLHDSGERDLSAGDHEPEPLLQAIEQRANGFAPAFIAPPDVVRAKYEGVDDQRQVVRGIANEWGFTSEGAIWHAKNIDLLTPSEAADLLADQAWRRQFLPSSQGWEPELPRDDPRDHGLEVETSNVVSGLLESRVLRAFHHGSISAGRAREILALS